MTVYCYKKIYVQRVKLIQLHRSRDMPRVCERHNSISICGLKNNNDTQRGRMYKPIYRAIDLLETCTMDIRIDYRTITLRPTKNAMCVRRWT